MQFLVSLFTVDRLAFLMAGLISFIGITVLTFSKVYMHCSVDYKHFMKKLALTIATVLILVFADNMILFFTAWVVSNSLLIMLIGHNKQWGAAQASSHLVGRYFKVGYFCLAIGMLWLFSISDTVSITTLLKTTDPTKASLPMILIIITAFIQSALFPFHKWIMSSLNSPTPVSAFMHAGLINGGGFLLERFAPLILNNPLLLKLLFVVGIISAVIGTSFKLIQSNIKTMLAASTVGQMGFMIAECGLGLFPAALAHLFWHGCFKAYLFLSSGSALERPPSSERVPPCLSAFALALVCGVLGSYFFTLVLGVAWISSTTQMILNIVVLLTGTQFAITYFNKKSIHRFSIICFSTISMSGLYGLSIKCIESFLHPLGLEKTITLTPFYGVGIIFLFVPWFLMLFRQKLQKTTWFCKWYVATLNKSQPASETITSRNQW